MSEIECNLHMREKALLRAVHSYVADGRFWSSMAVWTHVASVIVHASVAHYVERADVFALQQLAMECTKDSKLAYDAARTLTRKGIKPDAASTRVPDEPVGSGESA